MEFLKGSTGLTPVRLYDNTRIQDARRCLRYFYFRHIRGWVQEAPTIALVFGSGWHSSQEVIWDIGPSTKDMTEVVKEAFKAFMTNWTENGLPAVEAMSADQMAEFAPRNPMVAMEMLYGYVDTNRRILKDPSLEVLAIEEPFAVELESSPTENKTFYIGKIDKEISFRADIFGIEHKTTSAYKVADIPSDCFRQQFLDSFSPNSQVDGYLHAMHMKYGTKMKSIWVDAALVHKKVHDAFRFIPVDRQVSQLDAWLWETRSWINIIEANKEALKSVSPDHPYMAAFPKNTNSCFDFNRNCPYHGVCKMWANPHGKEMPVGYRQELWSPFNVVRLEKLGFEEKV